MEGAPYIPAGQLNVPYAERWELLKEVMVWFYLEYTEKYKKLKSKEIVKIMEQNYRFYAS